MERIKVGYQLRILMGASKDIFYTMIWDHIPAPPPPSNDPLPTLKVVRLAYSIKDTESYLEYMGAPLPLTRYRTQYTNIYIIRMYLYYPRVDMYNLVCCVCCEPSLRYKTWRDTHVMCYKCYSLVEDDYERGNNFFIS